MIILKSKERALSTPGNFKPNLSFCFFFLQLKFLHFFFVNRVAQTRENEEKVADYLHEVDKPLARYRDDVDLDKMLKDQERDDDPMLAYVKQKKAKQNVMEGKKGLCLLAINLDFVYKRALKGFSSQSQE